MSWKTKACPTLGTNLMCTGATTVTAWLLCLANQNDRRTARRHGHTAAGRQAGRRHARSAAVSHVSARGDRVASGAGRCDGTGALVGDLFPVGPGRSRSLVPDILEAADAMRSDVMAACGPRCPCPGRTGLSALLPSQMTRRSVRLPTACPPSPAKQPFRSVLSCSVS